MNKPYMHTIASSKFLVSKMCLATQPFIVDFCEDFGKIGHIYPLFPSEMARKTWDLWNYKDAIRFNLSESLMTFGYAMLDFCFFRKGYLV